MGEVKRGWEPVRRSAGCLPWGAGISLLISLCAVPASSIISACLLRKALVRGKAHAICVRGTGSFEQKGSTLSQVLINHVNLDKLPSEFQFFSPVQGDSKTGVTWHGTLKVCFHKTCLVLIKCMWILLLLCDLKDPRGPVDSIYHRTSIKATPKHPVIRDLFFEFFWQVLFGKYQSINSGYW